MFLLLAAMKAAQLEEQVMRAVAVAVAMFFSAVLAAASAQSAERWAELPAFPPMPPAKTSGMAPVNDIKIYYAEYGAGDPILFRRRA